MKLFCNIMFIPTRKEGHESTSSTSSVVLVHSNIWSVLRHISQQVQCFYGAQWLRIAQSKESTKLGADYLKMEAEPNSEMPCFKNSRWWTKTKKKDTLSVSQLLVYCDSKAIIWPTHFSKFQISSSLSLQSERLRVVNLLNSSFSASMSNTPCTTRVSSLDVVAPRLILMISVGHSWLRNPHTPLPPRAL